MEDDPMPPDPSTASGARLDPRGAVVVGLDRSDEARRGLLFAADLAVALGVELVVVHAFGLVGTFGDWREGVEERERQVTTALVDDWCAPLAERPDLTWSWRCVQGTPVDGILRAADETGAGLIVVGSHGEGRSSSPVMGSTSHDIVRLSHRPVVVVPPPADHPHRHGEPSGVDATG
ncbi:MAG: universal stress protein [Ilumatobacter sp.]|uniref:universal stress protein n=1 Tax=Ilumatobacter sp. TaxID=1967498 RepID=UPI00329A7615